MKLYSIENGYFKLDGGAMYGIVPRTIWQKFSAPDSNNLIPLSTRSLLIEQKKRLILIDCGMGDKQSEKFFSYYFRFNDDNTDSSLAKYGFSRDDISDVILTHLHFDHCGGAIRFDKNKEMYYPAFKNATYWVSELQWKWATQGEAVREKASFLKENIMPIEESGQLRYADPEIVSAELGLDIYMCDGHTRGQIIPIITHNDKKIIYSADLFPTHGHIPLIYTAGYDIAPMESVKEKEVMISNHIAPNPENTFLFFGHDADVEMCSLQHTHRGWRMQESLRLEDIF